MVVTFDLLPVSGLATGVAVLVGLYLVLSALSSRRLHPQEPPIIAPAIPFVGHLIGMALEGGKYVKSLGYATKLPKSTNTAHHTHLTNPIPPSQASRTTARPSSPCPCPTRAST